MTMPRKILVTDDDPRNRKLQEALLRASGHDVRSVESGRATLAAVAAEPPDLILLDLMMPGMDGFEVVRQLRADPASCHIPIIMVTALDDAGSRARLTAAGVSEVIAKPVDRWVLLTAVDKVLGASRGTD